jgi:hypothetical protein
MNEIEDSATSAENDSMDDCLSNLNFQIVWH